MRTLYLDLSIIVWILFIVSQVDTRPGVGNAKGILENSVGPKLDKLPAKKLSQTAVDKIKDVCKKSPNSCKGQPEKAKQTKNVLKQVLSKKGKKDDEIDQYFRTVVQAKKAALIAQGLEDTIEPHDDGLWAGDQMLSLKQLQRIIDSANQSTSTSTRPKRSNGISLDYYIGDKWPSTVVNYYIDPYIFSKDEADLIRNAIKFIQSGTCLIFVESTATPYIQFDKTPYGTSTGTCGWGYLGYNGDINDAYVNFDSPYCKPTLQGIIIHEILHILGVSHEHNRYDRDTFINMQWDNVDPQQYDVYRHDDSYDYNPYCVGYDYDSVMHYSPYVAVLDSTQPAFTLVSNPESLSKIGTALEPTTLDLAWINRLYCSQSSCDDTSPYCGWTACNDCTTYAQSCRKSCGKC